MAYTSTAEVRQRLPNRTIDGSSKPPASAVDQWVIEAEALVEAELAAAGIGVPVTTSRGVEVLKNKCTDYVAGLVERAYVSGTNLEDTDVGLDLIERFEAFLSLIRTDPNRVKPMLGVGSGTSASNVRAYPTDNADGKSIAAGDFDPVATRDMEF